MIDSLLTVAYYPNIYENLVTITEISFERYHILNTASAIREADAEAFEDILIEAAKKLNVDIFEI